MIAPLTAAAAILIMDSSKILALIEQLDDEIDDLEESLEPLLKAALSDTASKLPLLDKAKLYVLVTYAIESMLFCKSLGFPERFRLTSVLAYLRLHGVKAREHPVFVELTRVRQYFDKIKTAETPAATRSLLLDKDAAHRFVRAGLVGYLYTTEVFLLTPQRLATRSTTSSARSEKPKNEPKRTYDSKNCQIRQTRSRM